MIKSCVLILLLWVVPARASVCDSLSFDQAFGQADLIVRARSVRTHTNWISGGWKYTLEVKESWKRPTEQMLIVNTPWEKDGGYVFEDGREYLVFIQKKFTMKTFQCVGNRPSDEAQGYFERLGSGYPPTTHPAYGPMVWVISLLALLALLFVGGIVLRKYWYKRPA